MALALVTAPAAGESELAKRRLQTAPTPFPSARDAL